MRNIIVLLLLAVVVTAVFAQTNRGNTIGNIANGGLYVEVDDVIIFNLQGETYKMKPNGTEITKISDNDSNNLNYMDGWIYFADMNDDNGLYKMRADGNDLQKLDEDVWADFVNVIGEWIYYSDNGDGIYKIKADGTDKTCISSEEVSYVTVFDDWVYYITDDFYEGDHLYRIKTDGTDKELLDSDNDIDFFDISDGWIYFSQFVNEGWNLYKMRLDGSEKTKISDITVSYLSVTGDWIYFADDDDNICISRMKKDGTNVTKLIDGPCDYMHIIGDNIYYTRTVYSVNYEDDRWEISVSQHIMTTDGTHVADITVPEEE